MFTEGIPGGIGGETLGEIPGVIFRGISGKYLNLFLLIYEEIHKIHTGIHAEVLKNVSYSLLK